MRNTLGFLFVSAMLTGASAMIGCGGTTSNTGPDGGTPTADMTAALACTTGTICAGGTIADQTLNLKDNTTATFTIKANPGYTGTVDITSDISSLSALSGGTSADVIVSAVPGVVTFTGTGTNTQTVTLKVATTTAAAAFSNMPITLHVVDEKDANTKLDLPFNLTVKAILTISFTGAGTTNSKHVFSLDTAGGTAVTPVNVRARTGGTTILFVNNDTNVHEIHGQGQIIHENQTGYNTAPNPTNNPPKDPANGGVYQLNQVGVTMGTSGVYYCHDHGSGATVQDPPGDHTINFIK